MRVTCPNCAAGYEVPDHLLAAGPRMLRCARCGTTFQAGIAVAEAAAAAPSPVAIPPPPIAEPSLAEPVPLTFPRAAPIVAERRGAASPPTTGAQYRRAGGSGVLLGAGGWLLTVALLVAGALAAVQQRSRVVAAWPASARIYGAAGLNPAAAGPPRPAATAGP